MGQYPEEEERGQEKIFKRGNVHVAGNYPVGRKKLRMREREGEMLE